MVRHFSVQRTNHAEIVSAFTQPREDLGHLQATLAVSARPKWRLHQIASLPFTARTPTGKWLPIVLVQHGLGVERIHLGEAAVEKEKDDVFGAWGKMRGLNRSEE